MANQEQLAILKQGVRAWNQWRQENPMVIPDLREADLSGIDLRGANLDRVDFYRAVLQEAKLQRANLHNAHLYRADLSGADLSYAILRGADLVRSTLIGTDLSNTDLRWIKLGEANLSKANLTGSAIYGISAWDVILDDAIQFNLAITKDATPTVTVDDLEVAQFVYMLTNYKKLRDVLNSMIQRGVLILGRFSDGGITLLQAIAEKLRENHYIPMIFDFERPDDRNYTETVITLVGISKFVIVDLSGPAVPQELYATVPHFHVPFVPFLVEGRRSYFTVRDFASSEWVLPPVKFKSEEHVLNALWENIILPAETKLKSTRELTGERLKMFGDALSAVVEQPETLITEDEVNKFQFGLFRKTALLQARQLTEEDFKQRGGTIQTREGKASFQPGAYLARGVDNEEWPITQAHFERDYERVSEPNEEGFASYRATDIRQAHQMSQAFILRRYNGDILTGKADDYIVKSGKSIWVIAQDTFAKTYEAE